MHGTNGDPMDATTRSAKPGGGHNMKMDWMEYCTCMLQALFGRAQNIIRSLWEPLDLPTYIVDVAIVETEQAVRVTLEIDQHDD